MYVSLGLIVAFVAALFLALSRKADSERAKTEKIQEEKLPLPFVLRSFFHPTEWAFSKILQEKLPPGYRIEAKTRLADILKPIPGHEDWVKMIWAKHLDFIIFNQNSKPVVAIEINGKSHLAQSRIDSDDFKKEALRAAGLPLEVVSVGEDFKATVDAIVQKYASS